MLNEAELETKKFTCVLLFCQLIFMVTYVYYGLYEIYRGWKKLDDTISVVCCFVFLLLFCLSKSVVTVVVYG